MEYEINMSIPVGSRLTFVLFLLTDFIYDPSEPDWAWQGVSLWLPGTNKHFTKTQNKRFCWYIWPVLFFLGMMSSVSASVSAVATVKVTFQYTSCTCACSKYCSVHTVTSCPVYCSIVSSKCAQEKFHKCHISTTQCVSAGGWVVQLEGQQFDTTRSFTIEILKTDQSRADFSLWWKKEQDYCCCCFSNSQSQKFPPRKLIRFFFLFLLLQDVVDHLLSGPRWADLPRRVQIHQLWSQQYCTTPDTARRSVMDGHRRKRREQIFFVSYISNFQVFDSAEERKSLRSWGEDQTETKARLLIGQLSVRCLNVLAELSLIAEASVRLRDITLRRQNSRLMIVVFLFL